MVSPGHRCRRTLEGGSSEGSEELSVRISLKLADTSLLPFLLKQVDPTSAQEDNCAGRGLHIAAGGFLPLEVLTHHGSLATD